MSKLKQYLFAFLLVSFANKNFAVELIIGEETVTPGMTFIFEGAVKDEIQPAQQNLAINQTDIHIEARVNWESEDKTPKGSPAGGFIPYLHIHAQITNEKSKQTQFVTLIPHINLVDNFHYARNMALPGEITDPYTVTFFISPPDTHELAFHKDWLNEYGESLLTQQTFTYKNINFEEVAKANRKTTGIKKFDTEKYKAHVR